MTLHLHWPQAIYVALTLVSLAYTTINHGKPRSNENVWGYMLGVLIAYALLIWGGFFK